MVEGWQLSRGVSPLVAAAIHDGHRMRPSLLDKVALDDQKRLQEEDPGTAAWLGVSDTRVRVERSRFECDLNRPPAACIYRHPGDAWGLQVWRTPLDHEDIRQSRRLYDSFYAELHRFLSELRDRVGTFVVYDLHSYNHRRQGPDGPPAPPLTNPEINVGTGTLNRQRWGHVVDAFIGQLRSYPFDGRRLDVRENVNFRGGYFSRWIHEHFGDVGCVLAIEVKKFFMDEWTGQFDEHLLTEVGRALRFTVRAVLDNLLDSTPTWGPSPAHY